MLFNYILKHFVKIGTLNVIDQKGKVYCFSGTAKPEFTIQFHSKKIQRRFLFSPSLAFGEGYMNGDFTLEKGNLYDFLSFCAINFNQSFFASIEEFLVKIPLISTLLHKYNSINRSQRNVAHHYDLRHEFYQLFLDKDLQYSCAYFINPKDDLETAQEQKKRHLAAKLQLKPHHKVLDIGCGWGGLAIYLAQKTGADVTGITLSEEQYKVATQRAKEAGLEDRVRFYLQDYRYEKGSYDRIISVGMFEHVGIKHYPEFFKKIYSLLKEDGIALLHSIGYSWGPSTTNPWLKKYIFPGGYCPALSETLNALEPTKLYFTDIEILHDHYAKTLRHWRNRFMDHQKEIRGMMDKRFIRMWEFYLASCEVAFQDKGFMVFQIQMMRNSRYAPLTRDYISEEENKLNQPIPTKRKKAVTFQ